MTPTLQELTLMFMKALASGQDLKLHVDADRIYDVALGLALTYLDRQK